MQPSLGFGQTGKVKAAQRVHVRGISERLWPLTGTLAGWLTWDKINACTRGTVPPECPRPAGSPPTRAGREGGWLVGGGGQPATSGSGGVVRGTSQRWEPLLSLSSPHTSAQSHGPFLKNLRSKTNTTLLFKLM